MTSFRFINPPSGFVYEDDCTRMIEGDREWIILHAARTASGQKMEFGTVEYNRTVRFGYTAESDMKGDIAIVLPDGFHRTYKERVRPLVKQRLNGASFEWMINDIDASF